MGDLLRQALALLEIIWDRRWLVLKVAAAICALSWILLLVLGSQYDAQARVFVDVKTAVNNVIQGIGVQNDVSSEVTLVREALTSHPQLMKVAERNDLTAGGKSMEHVIEDLQSRIKVTPERQALEGMTEEQARQSVVYRISYRDSSPTRATGIVSTLLDVFVKDTLAGNRSGSSQAQQFLSSQISDYEKRLAAAEARLADFKKNHLGMIPGDRGDYFSRLDKEIGDRQTAQTNLAIALSRRDALRRQLDGSTRFVPGTSTGGAAAGGLVSDVTTRRQEAEAKLADLLTRFTDKHPEVIATRQTVAELKVAEAKEMADLQRGGAGSGSIRSLSANPVYQSIQSQLNQADVELAALRGAISQHDSEIASLQKVVNSAPEVEQEYSRLNRDYGATKAQYEALVQRLEQARVSENATEQGAVRFEIIDPPRADPRPVFPNRPLLALAALALAFAVGMATALVLGLSKPAFRTVESLQELGVPVLGSIGLQVDSAAKLARNRDMRHAIAFAVALVVVGLAMARLADPIARQLHNIPTQERSP